VDGKVVGWVDAPLTTQDASEGCPGC
jgi:hypothetical protein